MVIGIFRHTFANRTRTLRCLSSRSCRRNLIALREHAHKRDRRRAGRPRDGLFLQSVTKNCSSRRTRFRKKKRCAEGSLPPVGLTPSLRQATLRTDNGRLPSVTFLLEATGR